MKSLEPDDLYERDAVLTRDQPNGIDREEIRKHELRTKTGCASEMRSPWCSPFYIDDMDR